MPRKNLNKEETLEALLERQMKLTERYNDEQKRLNDRKKKLDYLNRKIEAEKEKQYLHNLKELGQIVVSQFGETFSQNDCKEMLKYIFAIREVQDFLRTEKDKQNEIQTEIISEENSSTDDNEKSSAEETQEDIA